MPDNQDKIIPIDYTHRDFKTIKKDLLQISERFYPSIVQDFSEGSVAAMLMDAVAYVGDQLSFYLDYNVNETFLDTAYEYNNIIRHGNIMGYRSPGSAAAHGTVSLFILIPAHPAGLGPDTRYYPLIKTGTTFSSNSGVQYTLTRDIDMADPGNISVVARTDSSTGAPTYYAVKAQGPVISGVAQTKTYRIGDYRRYRSLVLPTPGVSEIVSVYDSQGNSYFEVESLAQDIIFRELSNPNYATDNVVSVLKPQLVSRKFVVRRNASDRTILQFGSGQEANVSEVATPQEAAMDIYGKDYISQTTFDPTSLSKNENYGIVPQNTSLTINYTVNDPSTRNSVAGTISRVVDTKYEFTNASELSIPIMKEIIESLEVTNETAIQGVVTSVNSTDIKSRIYDNFASQNRCVTQADYESMAYRMPGRFGSLKRVSAQRDPNSLTRNMNLYVISENSFKKLQLTNSTIKNNLKTWLNYYRMMNDSIDILDPFIINFGIEYSVRLKSGANRFTSLAACNNAIASLYEAGFYIGEPANIGDIYAALKYVPGVLDVTGVKLLNRNGTGYSNSVININQNLSPDGSTLMTPKNAILELKYPSKDLIGKIV